MYTACVPYVPRKRQSKYTIQWLGYQDYLRVKHSLNPP